MTDVLCTCITVAIIQPSTSVWSECLCELPAVCDLVCTKQHFLW